MGLESFGLFDSLDGIEKNLQQLVINMETIGIMLESFKNIAILVSLGRGHPVADHLYEVYQVHVVDSMIEVLGVVAIFGIVVIQSRFQFCKFVTIFFGTILQVLEPRVVLRKRFDLRRLQLRVNMANATALKLIAEPPKVFAHLLDVLHSLDLAFRNSHRRTLCKIDLFGHYYHLRNDFNKIQSRPPGL